MLRASASSRRRLDRCLLQRDAADVQMVRNAGATEVALSISSPRSSAQCFYESTLAVSD